jgi:hypothetical protein
MRPGCFLDPWGGLVGGKPDASNIAAKRKTGEAVLMDVQDSLAAALVTQRDVGDLVESSLRLLIDVGGEADATALWRWRLHELSDRRENGGVGALSAGIPGIAAAVGTGAIAYQALSHLASSLCGQ